MDAYDFPKVTDLVAQKKGLTRAIRTEMEAAANTTNTQAERHRALRSSYHALKTMMIGISPITPFGAEELRRSLRLDPENAFTWEGWFDPFPGNHQVAPLETYFPRGGTT